jgi:hypothetical protein
MNMKIGSQTTDEWITILKGPVNGPDIFPDVQGFEDLLPCMKDREMALISIDIRSILKKEGDE